MFNYLVTIELNLFNPKAIKICHVTRRHELFACPRRHHNNAHHYISFTGLFTLLTMTRHLTESQRKTCEWSHVGIAFLVVLSFGTAIAWIVLGSLVAKPALLTANFEVNYLKLL